jgi:hypothetical protein
MKSRIATCLAALGLTAAGCAGTAPPTERLTTAQASVKAGRMLGAEEVPQAQLHLRMAEQSVARAQKLMRDDENELADLMLQQANADAQVALALTRESQARGELGMQPRQEVTP